MAKDSTFQTFYEETLKNQLIEIEAERSKEFKKIKAARKKGAGAGAVVALFFAWGVMAMQPVASIITFIQAFLVFGIFFGLAGLVVGNHYTVLGLEKFRLPFKQKIINPIIKHFNATLTYHPEERISNKEVEESRLFQEDISLFKGDDLIEGKDGEVKFRFSEIRLHIEVKRSDHNGTPNWVHLPFFKGIFLVAEFPEPLIGTLIVRPNPAFKESGKNIDLLRKYAEKQTRWKHKRYLDWSPAKAAVSGSLQEIKTTDSAFDEQFLVYSTDQSAAEYLVRSKLKDRLMALKESDYEQSFMNWQSGKSAGDFQIPAPYCAIVGNKFYLAKPYNRQFFNTNLERSIVEPEITENYFREISELTSLVKGVTQAFQKSE